MRPDCAACPKTAAWPEEPRAVWAWEFWRRLDGDRKHTAGLEGRLPVRVDAAAFLAECEAQGIGPGGERGRLLRHVRTIEGVMFWVRVRECRPKP